MLKEQIKNIVAQVLECEVDDTASQANCATWDSLHHLNLVVELETAFNVSFEPEEMARMKDIPTLEAIIASKQ